MGSYAKFVSDYCKAWDKSGKEQFIKTVTQFIKDDEKSPLFTKSGKLSGVSQSIYDLLLSGLRGALKRDAVLNVLKDITVLHADIPSILLDVVCVLDAETCTDIQSEERSNFCHIVRELESFISDKLLKERLEIDTLQDVGTLKNKNFYTKFIKIKTKLYYKQRKFNLFREESEGYAKLIVELNQEISEEVDWKTILEIIQSLIGCFNLDPNRVLDIILESFEARPHLDQLFIPLIKNYMGDPQVISEVLGFKLGNMEVLESYKEPPPLMMIIALLLQHQVISLDDIYPWLRPDDSIMAKEADKEIRAAQDYIRKLSIVSTKGPQANAPAEFIEEKADPQEYWSNQKLVLSEALLKVTAWREFAALSARLPTAAMPQRPALALCTMLHALVEPLYRKHCRVAPKIIGKPVPPLKSSLAPRACETFEDIKETVIPALILLGPSLHYDPILMYKIIRILRTSRSQPGDPLQHCALTVLDAAILPALTLMEGNCCCAEEVYSLLKLYPYQCRYWSICSCILQHCALTVLDAAILPALTLMEGNCCCAEEVYSLLKLYPYQCSAGTGLSVVYPLQYSALKVLDAAILPALTLMEGNCCCAEEVYSLLKLYPYQCRYCLSVVYPLQHCALTVLDAAILPALTLMEGNCCCAEEVYSLLKLYPYQCSAGTGLSVVYPTSAGTGLSVVYPLQHCALTVLDAAILPALTLMEGNCCCAEEVYSLLKLYPYQCSAGTGLSVVYPLQHCALTVLDAAILPALTLMEGNCCCAEEVYSLLKLYPYQCRYCLYSRWKNESAERSPALLRVRGNSLQRIKHIMKRLSKENVKPQGRLIGKLSHAAPAFLFDYMLLQIQTYDNLIGPVVESLKYLTSLSLDVLGYCLLEALCAGRSLMGGAAHPPWLQALAAFAGAAFKKHNIELTALLQFVANRLKAQQSQDLLILKEIVQKMAGIEAAEEMTPEQLEAMAGGDLLKGEVRYKHWDICTLYQPRPADPEGDSAEDAPRR
ncbi:transcription- and export-related complex subunit domain-containing protein [Phthorimaea operculella]|nr:transcription- and export-related complex subunit domain-containing protein [Phthorimaea operculella]